MAIKLRIPNLRKQKQGQKVNEMAHFLSLAVGRSARAKNAAGKPAVELATVIDLAAVHAIEDFVFRNPFPLKTLSQIVHHRHDPLRCFVCRVGQEVVGCSISDVIGDQSRLVSIAVAPKHRFNGYGRLLLENGSRYGLENNLAVVPEANVDAQCFFSQCGFRCRKAYRGYFTDGQTGYAFDRDPRFDGPEGFAFAGFCDTPFAQMAHPRTARSFR